MATKTLAVKYRPTTFDDVTEQSSIKLILQQQLQSNAVKNAYLFCGPAGCGKTTCARIFADAINEHNGTPIELDAASNNGVDDVREIIQQAQTRSINSEYKIFIIDECHALSNNAWQAMLKIIEEPPVKSIFIFCTTDPQKIPKTILSRVQRYDFQRISHQGIVNRLVHILSSEYPSKTGKNDVNINVDRESLEYIAKIADGGMRDAISLMDKALAYNKDLSLENVVSALGTIDYDTMLDITDKILSVDAEAVIVKIEELFSDGKDLKHFIRQYLQFILDVNKCTLGCDWKYISIPKLDSYVKWIDGLTNDNLITLEDLMETLMHLNSNIKYSASPKSDIECELLVFIRDGE